MVSVEVIRGPDKGRVFALTDDAVIGRQSDSVALSDGTVSRQHARLVDRDGNWVLEDLGSVNGTSVNGVRVNKPVRLQQGDQIRCGGTLLVFGGSAGRAVQPVKVDEDERLDAAIMATVPANEDSVIIPTPEAGAEAIDNLRILYSLTTAISSIFDLDLMLKRALDMIVEVVKAGRAYILLIGPEGELITKAALDHGEPAGEDVPISRTIINEVVQKQVGVLSSNAMRDKRFSSGQSVHDYGIRSAICVPIKGRDKVLGVIHADSSVADHTYSTEQLRLLSAIGYATGLAVENVHLYEAAVRSERLAAMGETVATLSHHIKNVLQALGGGTDVVEKALREKDLGKAMQAWPIVRRNLDRINGVILNMLAYSRPRQTLLESVDVNAVLRECLELMAPDAADRAVALMTDLAEAPPVRADSAGLHQALLNLLTNAMDAVKPGAGVVTVTSEYDSMNRLVVVKVADNGVGIEKERLGRIFELFHSTKGGRGTGLGLAVTRKVILEHAGRIAVESAPGQGTTFTVTLPAQAGGRSPGDTVAP